MKKIIFLSMLLIADYLYSLPVGNPSEASLFYHEPTPDGCGVFYDIVSVGVGFYGDYVFNRHLRTIHDHDIEQTKINTNACYLVLSLFEKADTFATLGTSNLEIHTNLSAFNARDPNPRFDLNSSTSFSWSLGERITLWECGALAFGVEGQYFETRPNIKRMYIATGAVAYADKISQSTYREWQAGLGLSYRIKDILPYAALTWSHAQWIFGNKHYIIEDNVNTFLFNLKNQKSWGYALGATISRLSCDRIAVTVEGRFANERALYVNGQIRF